MASKFIIDEALSRELAITSNKILTHTSFDDINKRIDELNDDVNKKIALEMKQRRRANWTHRCRTYRR